MLRGSLSCRILPLVVPTGLGRKALQVVSGHSPVPTASPQTQTCTFQRIRLSRCASRLTSRLTWPPPHPEVLYAPPCDPSPCIEHYLDHLSTMAAPSPRASRPVSDPAVPVSVLVGT
jgi:hypothetical protein